MVRTQIDIETSSDWTTIDIVDADAEFDFSGSSGGVVIQNNDAHLSKIELSFRRIALFKQKNDKSLAILGGALFIVTPDGRKQVQLSVGHGNCGGTQVNSFGPHGAFGAIENADILGDGQNRKTYELRLP